LQIAISYYQLDISS